jgi:hypothetical protein
VTDAGGGAGEWTVTAAPQTQTAGVEIDVPPRVTIAAGGDVSVPVVVRAPSTAATGENTGFVVFANGSVTRRVPYAFLVERPALAALATVPLHRLQTGTTTGTSRVSAYCCPSSPFGPPPDYTGAPMNEDGSEHVYTYEVTQPVVNFGVSIVLATPGSLVDPFVLGSPDENDVQGYTATPTDVNPLTFDYLGDVGAAGVQFPRLRRFDVAVDSRADPYTNKPLEGSYVLNAWVDDVAPPALRLVTTRVNAGRPLVVAQALDAGSGVDPLSLTLNYRQALVGASAYDPTSGLAAFLLPQGAPPLTRGTTHAILFANDYQETKNVSSVGGDLYPNSAFQRATMKVVTGPVVTWVLPQGAGCQPRTVHVAAAGGSTAATARVVFRDGRRTIARLHRNALGLYSATLHAAKGVHRLTVTLVDADGRAAKASRRLVACR